MFQKLRKKIAMWLFPEYIDLAEKTVAEYNEKNQVLKKNKDDFEKEVNRRVADVLLHMDPFQPLMKKFNGIFSVEYERPEDPLNEQSKIGMYMWAWQQKHDPSFKYMTDWIMNKSGNSLLKTGNPTELQTFFKRAEIANMILFKREVGRLSSHYEEIMNRKPEEFDAGVAGEV